VNRRSIAQRQRCERERQECELSNRRQESVQQTPLARSSVNLGVLHHEAHMAARYITPPTTQDATGNGVANPVRPSVPALPIQHDQGKLILAYNITVF